MGIHPELTTLVYVGASVVFALVVLYWILYTRRLKIPPGVGTEEGIAMATQKKERAGRAGTLT